MPNAFASGRTSIAECDRCGFRYHLTQLKPLVIKTKVTNIMVCPTCWEPDQPQLSLGLYPVNDPQAVRNPRPDVSYNSSGNSGLQIEPTGEGILANGLPEVGSRVIQWGWNPVGGASLNDAGLTPNYLTSVGETGTAMINVAAWSSSTPYSPADSVSYSGGYYLAIKANVNHAPTDVTYWASN
jgi:hypothetical protein